MDPLTCLSVASNVVQFIDFTMKVFTQTRNLYQTGILELDEQIARAIKDLSSFSTQIGQSIRAEGDNRALTENELELETICQDCSRVAADLAAQLKKYDIVRGHRLSLFKSVGQVIAHMWTSKELDATEKRLTQYRDMMNSRLLGSLWERVSQVQKEQYNHTEAINNKARQIIASALLEIHASLSRNLNEQTKVISALLDQNVRNFGDINRLHRGTIRDVRERSSLYAITEEDKQIYFNIQRREALLHQTIAREVVEGLLYETVSERYEAVSETHQKTFEWIFEPMDENNVSNHPNWSDFVKWLREEDGIYWINGKAGSGKSTLIKYICENPKTQDHLQVWAGDTPLYTASYFFWWRGTALQKSQDGLIRTLLYDVLHQLPELVRYVLPSKWASRYAAKTNIAKFPPIDAWPTSLLKKAFRTLITQKEISMKLCLFIDGLDEYDGLEVDIARIFKGVILSPSVKVCISSRPLVPFEDAFASYPKLRLQDLTDSDIHRYVQDRLVHDDMMKVMMKKEPKECQDLVDEITETAQGVFLWVMLVVSSLINGLSNHDQISDLQRRLKALPKDLDALYEEMVLKVDGVYATEASRLYQLVAEANPHPGDWKPAQLLSVYTLSLAMKPEFDIAREIGKPPLPGQAILAQAKRMELLLKTRCGGLLEVQYGKLKSADLSPSMKVSYLHRTVGDFLEAWGTRQVLLKRTGGSENDAFKPAVAIFKALAIQIQHFNSRPTDHMYMYQNLEDQGKTYARRIDDDKRVLPEELLNIFDIFAQIAKWDSMVAVAITCPLSRYLQLKLVDEQVSEHATLSRPALSYALVPTSAAEHFVNVEIVSLLLKFGANPNKSWKGSTPWQSCLSYLICNYDRLKTERALLMHWGDIIVVLLENGADPGVRCKGPDKFERRGKEKRRVNIGNSWLVLEVFNKIFEELPSTSINLERLLKKAIQDKKDSKQTRALHSARNSTSHHQSIPAPSSDNFNTTINPRQVSKDLKTNSKLSSRCNPQ